MNVRDKELILEFKRKLPSKLKNHLRKLIVFGSRARGDALEDSDIDVIAVVDKRTPAIEKGFDNVVYQVMWDHDFRPIISLKVLAESQFYDALNRGFSFYKYVEEEGIPL